MGGLRGGGGLGVVGSREWWGSRSGGVKGIVGVQGWWGSMG